MRFFILRLEQWGLERQNSKPGKRLLSLRKYGTKHILDIKLGE